jgi:hypothetical protein
MGLIFRNRTVPCDTSGSTSPRGGHSSHSLTQGRGAKDGARGGGSLEKPHASPDRRCPRRAAAQRASAAFSLPVCSAIRTVALGAVAEGQQGGAGAERGRLETRGKCADAPRAVGALRGAPAGLRAVLLRCALPCSVATVRPAGAGAAGRGAGARVRRTPESRRNLTMCAWAHTLFAALQTRRAAR